MTLLVNTLQTDKGPYIYHIRFAFDTLITHYTTMQHVHIVLYCTTLSIRAGRAGFMRCPPGALAL